MFILSHTLHKCLINGQRVIQYVLISVLRFPERLLLGLVYEVDYPPIVVPALSIIVGILQLVFSLVL